MAMTGAYIVPDEFDARKLIMFPFVNSLNQSAKLTNLEIYLAQKNLPVLQQIPKTDCFRLTTP